MDVSDNCIRKEIETTDYGETAENKMDGEDTQNFGKQPAPATDLDEVKLKGDYSNVADLLPTQSARFYKRVVFDDIENGAEDLISQPVTKKQKMSPAYCSPIKDSFNANKIPNSTQSITPITSTILSTLTDDMFVLETASFVVPYIYERPPIENLKDIVEKIGLELADQQSKEPVSTVDLKKIPDDDDSWKGSSNGSDTSTSSSISDDDLEDDIKKKNATLTTFDTKGDDYFKSPLGIFFMDIGLNLVQEYDITDLLHKQKHSFTGPRLEMKKILDRIKVENKYFKFKTLSCENCNFKSESSLAIANHNDNPHHFRRTYKCNFCLFKTKKLSDITCHMDDIHNVKTSLEKSFSETHQCPYCPYENCTKARLARHVLVCSYIFRSETNQSPSLWEWNPPARNLLVNPEKPLVNQVIPL